jgi:D-alanine-D-alanine ligase
MALHIGFAFNQKPAEEGSSDEDPPSSEPPGPGSLDRFAEWDDAATIAAVERALSLAGEVVRLEAGPDFPALLRDTNPDIVFNIAEGRNGPNREAHVPAICEFYGVPYSGSDVLTLALTLDKRRAKEVLRGHGIATPEWLVAGTSPSRPKLSSLGSGPWLVKPVHEGSSKGITERALCRTPEEVSARVEAIVSEYSQQALIERFLTGREFTLGVLGNGGSARVLPLVEIRFDALPAGAAPLYGYEAKWLWDTPDRPLQIFSCPADTGALLRQQIEQTALAAYHALGCRDWARIDVRLDAEGTPHVLELNPLPGILPDPEQNSCLPKAARAAGMSYDELIQEVLRHAGHRYGIQA